MDFPKLKIALIGRPGSGKKTLNKIFFERQNPLDILDIVFEKNRKEPQIAEKIYLDISMYDLTGSSFVEWNKETSCSWSDFGVIFVILDANDDWNDNLTLIREFDSFIRSNHINASIGILFHKIDRLTVQKLEELKSQVDSIKKDFRINIDLYLTSNQPEFINDTIYAIQSTIVSVYKNSDKSDYNDLFIQIQLLRYFKQHEKADYNKLKSLLRMEPLEIVGYINVMVRDKFLIKDKKNNTIRITEKGKRIVTKISEIYRSYLREALLAEINYVKGFILANLKGSVLFSYEISNGFFDSIVPASFPEISRGDLPENKSKIFPRSPAKPNLPFFNTSAKEVENDKQAEPEKTSSEIEKSYEKISHFFANIVKFGEKMDFKGLNSFYLSGKNVRLIARVYRSIIGIFVVDRVDMDKGLWMKFYQFLRRFYENNEDKISKHIDEGSIIDDKDLTKQLEQEVQFFDMIVKSHYQGRSQISFNKILHFYKDLLKNENLVVPSKELKNILYQYLLCENPDSLDEI